MLRPKSIRTKLVLLYLAIAIPLAVTISFNAYQRYQHQIENIYKEREDFANLVATNFRGFIHGIATTLDTAGHAISKTNMTPGERVGYLAEITRHNPVIADIAYVDIKGDIIATNKPENVGINILSHTYFRETIAGQKLNISNYEQTFGGAYGFTVSLGIKEDGKLKAVMVAAINTNKLDDLMPSLETGFCNVVDTNSTVVYQNQHDDVALRYRDWSSVETVQEALHGEVARTSDFTCLINKEKHFLVNVPIEEFGWAAGSGVENDKALDIIGQDLIRIRDLPFIMFVLAFVLSLIVGRSISGPIISLARKARLLGEEQFDEPIIMNSGDELEVLARELDGARTKLLSSFKSMNLLLDASTSLTRSLDISDVTSTLSDTLLELLAINKITVAAYDHVRHEVLVLSSRHTPYMSVGERHAVADMPDIYRKLYENKRRAVIDIDDPALDEKTREFFHAYEVSYIILHPLLIGERMIGHIALGNTAGRPSLMESDFRMIESIAAQAAVAIENARLFEKERDVAETLQQALLTVPSQLPGVMVYSVYEGAMGAYRVGGDFFDAFEIELGKIGFVIGDVSGKGLEAAAITSTVKSTIRSFAYQNLTAAEVMARTNRVISKQLDHGLFVTVIFGILDTVRGELNMVSAGHPDMIICCDGEYQLLTPPRNMPIGIFPENSFEDLHSDISDSNALILYTDGLIEAKHGSELFGEQRVMEELIGLATTSYKELPKRLVASAKRFGGGSLADDVAMLILQIDRIEKDAPQTSPALSSSEHTDRF